MAATAAQQVAHIWRRLGFGPTAQDVADGTAAGPQNVIAALLARPLTTQNQWGFPTGTDWQDEDLFIRMVLANMAGPANPVQERLSWILRNLVVVGTDGADYPSVRDFWIRLRQDPFASYKQLLLDVTTEPAMLRYLTGFENNKYHPNQNYARELMELFSLGITHPTTGARNYTETDIQEMARALTGWTYNWTDGTVSFDAGLFDSGNKTFLGQPRGNAGVTGVIDAVSTHPSFPYFVPARLYRELVGLTPSNGTLDALASVWGTTGDVRAVVTAICALPDFLSDAAINAKVKTPVELIVAASRVLNINLQNPSFWWELQDFMGMDPLSPPNVAGWPAGKRWLNATGLLTWSGIVEWLVHQARVTSGSPVDQLFQNATANTATTEVARLACLTFTPSTTTALTNYAKGATWDIERAAGTFAVALLSPEFLAN